MKLQNKISKWLKDYLEKNKLDTFVVGVSGGIDSAVTSTLCAMTGKRTIVVTMPIHQNQEETFRGIDHISWLKEKYSNVEQYNVELTSVYNKLTLEAPALFQNDLSLANTRARIRMSTLYLIAGGSKGIVVGTGNKVEDFGVGFFTKYGDQLGVSYDELEWAINYDGSEIDERQQHILNVYNKHRNTNLHKMKNIPVFRREN